ncbi:plasmalemma vesicle associated protein a isoform X1 [Etheostoma spectabile]|uniref:plasmalemma vesicle associated protein a isoform X1 n=1 Tax=Etheostoma spectabile TaxID=54343 RepID=UPI0013AF0148|nr:keratin, type I cytoskeletal 9-like isoform X1 [Etheostoma spectabile]
MYSRYSQVSKSSPQKKMQHRSKGKSCGYYMRIVFFFSSLIQSLIIVSLVLFLVYGKTQDSASTTRIQDLEESFSRLSIENVALRLQRKNLTNLLNTTLTEKARNDWDLVKLRHFSNISLVLIQDIDKKMQQCNIELFTCKNTARCPTTFQVTDNCNCGLLTERLKARLDLVEANFTQTTQRLRMEMDQTAKERDTISLEAIRLRRDKSTHEKEVEFFRQKCKDDFAQSLSGISNVSKAFREKISSLFSTHIAFQLTCPKQRDHLEQIRTNCTSLSMEVEDKFQRYLDSVGGQVSAIQAESSRLKAENWRLSDDYRWCTTNRTGLMLQHGQNLAKLQRKHDEDKERLLIDKMRLNGDLDVLRHDVKYKSKEVDHLTEQIKQLNMSCVLKTSFGFPSRSGTQPQLGWGLGGGSSSASSSSSFGVQPGRAGSGGLSSSSGSFPSTFNKPVSNGAGSSSSSVLSSGSGSSTGSGFNRPGQGSIGTGSSSSSVSSTGSGSSVGSAFNKPGLNGAGSSSSSVLSSGSGSSTGSVHNRLGQGSVGAGSSSSSVLSSGSGSSTGSVHNRLGQGSVGAGSSSSSVLSSGSGSSTGLGVNRLGQGSVGAGSSSSSVLSSGSGSSTGAGFNTGGGYPNIGSASNPNLSPSGTGSNNPAQSGRGSPTFGSSSGSSGTGSNKPASGSSLGSSSGSSAGATGATGATSKSGSVSNPFAWLGLGNSGQSKSGSGTGKVPSTGNSYGGTGSSFGAGRTSGLGSGSVNVAQHVKDLQRIINPSGPEEKQDLSRMLG